MAQVTAGEVVTLGLEGESVTVKIEDASKSESILAKVQSSGSVRYPEGSVQEFPRSVLG